MPPARSHAYRWMRLADRRYITARFLFRKGLLEDLALTGAFAFELYLKAFIVQMHRSFSVHHKLTALCDTCRQSDDFFERFVNDPDWEYGWPAYWDMYRYPEPIPGNRTGGKTYIGSHELQQLDELAHFVRQRVDVPQDQRGSIGVFGDPIDWLLREQSNAQMPGFANAPTDVEELRRYFREDNYDYQPPD